MASSCPDFYIGIKGQCFQVFLEKLTWAKAQLTCQDDGGHLAEPKDIQKFYEYMSDKIEGWHPFWVGASKDKYGYWKWKSTSEYVDHKLWVESHSRAFNSPDSCANVLPGHYKLGLHGGLCNNTYYYVCEANTAMSEEALLPSEVSPTDSSPTTVITSSAVISVAGIFAIFLLILIILFITRKRLRNSKPNIQPELKDKSAVPNSDSRIPNIIFLGDAPIFPDLVVDHPNGSAIPRLNVKLDDKSDEPRIKELLQCGREICEEDKLSVSDHLGLRWCEVGRRMKFSDGQIENIRADYPRSIDRAYELLTIWHDRESQKATVAKLAAILLQSNAKSALSNLRI